MGSVDLIRTKSIAVQDVHGMCHSNRVTSMISNGYALLKLWGAGQQIRVDKHFACFHGDDWGS